jgi:CHAT domain-containing protein/tetratricopeptide (TPR) repeat protein
MYEFAMLIRPFQLGLAGLALAIPLRVGAGTCDPVLTDRPAVLDVVLELAGNGVANRTARFLPRTTVVLVAIERGVDVTLQVSGAGGVTARADNPVRRIGDQRVVLTPSEGAEYTIVVTGKEHAELRGRIQLRAVAFEPEESNDACLAIQRVLAAADAAYAVGQRVTRHLETNSRVDAPSSYKLAARQYEAAAQQLGRTPSQLLARSQLAVAAVDYQDIEDWKAAKLWAEKAESTFAVLHDEYGRARSQALGAGALMELALQPQTSGTDTALSAIATLKHARATLEALVTFHYGRHERYDAALAYNSISITYYMEGAYEQAIASGRRAENIYAQLRERPRQAQSLQNIAEIEYELGRFTEAAPLYAKALTLVSLKEDPARYPTMLNNSALVNWASGRYDAALRQYDEALGLARELQDKAQEAGILHNIGSVYYSMGDEPFALEFYDEALRLSSVERDPVGRTALLRTIGNIRREQGDLVDALRMHEEALALAASPTTKDQVLIQVARDLAALDRPAEAQQRLSQVLDRRIPGDDIVRARALLERSRMRMMSGDFRDGESDIHTALRTFRMYDLPQDLFEAWLALARLERRSGATDAAFDALNKALALAEELRVQTANPELRATRLQPLRAAFDLRISMIADRYFASSESRRSRQALAVAALATAEQARARALQDFRNLDLAAAGVPPALVRERTQIYAELAARRYRLETQLDRVKADDPLVVQIRSDIADLRRRLDEIDARIGAASPLADPNPAGHGLTLANLHALPPDVAVVEYWLGTDGPIAWTVTADGIGMTRLTGLAEINSTAREWLTALRGFGTVPPEARLSLADRVCALVLDPIATEILDKRVVLFAPDGALHYMPFAAMRIQESGHKHFLVERHDVAIVPSIGTVLGAMDRLRREPTRQMLLVADPIYTADDPRLTKGAGAATQDEVPTRTPSLAVFRGGTDAHEFGRLPGTAREAALIAALMPHESVDRLEGASATRERFLGASLGSYRFIHIASHAVADSEVPQASALIFSMLDARSHVIDGRVFAADLMGVRLNADAVVLSACGTALGTNVAGEGLLGLQYVVLARGAKSVVSSLWPVVDQSAASFMGRFYASLLRPGSSPLTALGGAMRAALATPSAADPSHWAAFMLTISRL